MISGPGSFIPKIGDRVHFRKRGWQSEHSTFDNGQVKFVKMESLIEAVGVVKSKPQNGCVKIKMLSWQDDAGTWIEAKPGVNLYVHLDDVDL